LLNCLFSGRLMLCTRQHVRRILPFCEHDDIHWLFLCLHPTLFLTQTLTLNLILTVKLNHNPKLAFGATSYIRPQHIWSCVHHVNIQTFNQSETKVHICDWTSRKDYGIGTLQYNWPMSAHALQVLGMYTSACDCTDSEHLLTSTLLAPEICTIY